MNKIIKNLIVVIAVLAFVLGPVAVSPALARSYRIQTGLIFTPTVYPTTTVAPVTSTSNNTNTTTENKTNTTNTTKTVILRSEAPSGKSVNLMENVSNAFDTSNYDTQSQIARNEASDINSEYGNLTANALVGSGGFWPTGIVQWIIVFIILVIMISLVRYVRGSKEEYMAIPAKHA